jgi:hypothetical protein
VSIRATTALAALLTSGLGLRLERAAADLIVHRLES